MTSITGIGRSLQPNLRTHQVALTGAVLAATGYAAVAAFTDRDVADALAVGLAVLISWMIGRELDPDRTTVAVIAMPLAFVASVYVVPSLLAAFAVLIAVRLVAGTVGAAITPVDLAVLAFIGFVTGSTSVLWIVGLAIGMWLFTSPEVGKLKPYGLVALIAGTVIGAMVADAQDIAITQEAYVLAAVGGVVMMLAMSPKTIVSNTDARSGIVEARRVGLARKAAGSFVMWAAIMGGVAGFWMVSPVLAALTATVVVKWFSAGA